MHLQDFQIGGQQLEGKHDTGIFDFLCGANASSESEPSFSQPPVPQAPVFSEHSCNSSSSNFGFLDHFSSAFSLSGSPPSPRDQQLSLMEHYKMLKSQQNLQSVPAQPLAQRYIQSGPPPPTCRPFTMPPPAANNYSSPAQACSPVAQTLDQGQLTLLHGNMLSPSPATPSSSKSIEEIFQHPWVASHLQELTSCFSLGKAEEHMAHLLDLKPKACGSPTKSHESHTPSSNSANSTEPCNAQVLSFCLSTYLPWT